MIWSIVFAIMMIAVVIGLVIIFALTLDIITLSIRP